MLSVWKQRILFYNYFFIVWMLLGIQGKLKWIGNDLSLRQEYCLEIKEAIWSERVVQKSREIFNIWKQRQKGTSF